MNKIKNERTLVVVKPDGIQRSLIGEIIKRYERTGLKLVAVKMILPDEKFVESHYTFDPEWTKKAGQKSIDNFLKKGLTPPTTDPAEQGQKILSSLKAYFTSGPVIAMVWEGAHAISVIRKITGGTEPATSDVGTIRGDFVIDSYEMSQGYGRAIRNLVHASSSVEDAEKEISHWFDKDEIISYKLINEGILYDVNMDGVLD